MYSTILFCFVSIAVVTGKPGICPDPATRGGIPQSTCNVDTGCAGYLKCCPNTFGAFTCAYPDFGKYAYEVPLLEEKAGNCPPVTQPGYAKSTCIADKDCIGLQKCCTNKSGASVCIFPSFSATPSRNSIFF